ncbi:MAG TPA: carbonic anhydrase [Burkholderiales bacterium]|nr:carbonic anhydrase [Burkholderiales bacterium]
MVDFLERGVRKFKREGFRENRRLFRKLAKRQLPRVLFITCADSRIVPSLITQTRPGDLFVERNPGNIVPVYSRHAVGVSASIEYAVDVLDVERVVVCGHSDCGAVKGILHPEKLATVPAVRRWLTDGNHSRRMLGRAARLTEREKLERLTELNVIVQLEHLETHPSVARRLKQGELALHGWVYDIRNGEILQLNERTGEFLPWP